MATKKSTIKKADSKNNTKTKGTRIVAAKKAKKTASKRISVPGDAKVFVIKPGEGLPKELNDMLVKGANKLVKELQGFKNPYELVGEFKSPKNSDITFDQGNTDFAGHNRLNKKILSPAELNDGPKREKEDVIDKGLKKAATDKVITRGEKITMRLNAMTRRVRGLNKDLLASLVQRITFTDGPDAIIPFDKDIELLFQKDPITLGFMDSIEESLGLFDVLLDSVSGQLELIDKQF